MPLTSTNAQRKAQLLNHALRGVVLDDQDRHLIDTLARFQDADTVARIASWLDKVRTRHLKP